MKWRKIKSAPKDGTIIDLWVKANGCKFRASGFVWSIYIEDWVHESTGYELDKFYGNVGMKPKYWIEIKPPKKGK